MKAQERKSKRCARRFAGNPAVGMGLGSDLDFLPGRAGGQISIFSLEKIEI
jgi:hypothetical protein